MIEITAIILTVLTIYIVIHYSKSIINSISYNAQLSEQHTKEIICSIKEIENEAPSNNPIEFTPNELCGHPTVFPDSLESYHLKINDKLYLLEYSSASSKLIDIENRRYWVSEEEDLDLPEEWEDFIKCNTWITI